MSEARRQHHDTGARKDRTERCQCLSGCALVLRQRDEESEQWSCHLKHPWTGPRAGGFATGCGRSDDRPSGFYSTVFTVTAKPPKFSNSSQCERSVRGWNGGCTPERPVI